MSIGYEALYYGALGLALIGWIFFENANLYISKGKLSTNAIEAVEDGILLSEYDRCLQLSDIRIPLIFVRNTGSWMEIGNSISHFGIGIVLMINVFLMPMKWINCIKYVELYV
nr:GPI ethanolamine phosphate transferase 1 [Ipomoea batatas]